MVIVVLYSMVSYLQHCVVWHSVTSCTKCSEVWYCIASYCIVQHVTGLWSEVKWCVLHHRSEVKCGIAQYCAVQNSGMQCTKSHCISVWNVWDALIPSNLSSPLMSLSSHLFHNYNPTCSTLIIPLLLHNLVHANAFPSSPLCLSGSCEIREGEQSVSATAPWIQSISRASQLSWVLLCKYCTALLCSVLHVLSVWWSVFFLVQPIKLLW
jgi:hypothetical protein